MNNLSEQVTREGYKAQFMPLQLPSCQITVLTTRHGPIKTKPQTEEKLYGKFDDYGGYFERVRTTLRHFYTEMELSYTLITEYC